MEIAPLLEHNFLLESPGSGQDITVIDRIVSAEKELEFFESIIVQETVANSFVKVRGNFTAEGVVRNSTILALGKVHINADIIDSTIIANHFISISSARNSNIYSEVDIAVQQFSENSNITAQGAIIAPRAKISGGNLLSCRMIHIQEALHSKEKNLHLEVGEEKILHEKIKHVTKKIFFLQQQFIRINRTIETKVRELAAENRIREGAIEIDILKKKRLAVEQQLDMQRKILPELKNYDNSSLKEKFIRVDGWIQEGVFVEIDDVFTRSHGISAIVFKTDGKKILHQAIPK